MNKRPNIVIFNPDQFRADALNHLGCEAAVTPNLDNLAKTDGVSFSNAFCQNTVCTPSRCSFMSGWYPHVKGHRTMHHMMKPDEPVLLKMLKDDGYFVWWGGKNDLVPGQNPLDDYCDIKYVPDTKSPNLHSSDKWRGDIDGDNYYSFYVGKLETDDSGKYYNSDWANVDGAVDFIDSYDEDKPFCMYLPLSYPHPPYGVEEPFYSSIDRTKIDSPIPIPPNTKNQPMLLDGIRENQHLQNWTDERFIELKATYYGMCSRIDYQFGMLVNALKKAGIYENTAIFFFSDHGDFTGDYHLVEKTQNTFQDCLSNVPFLIKPPANVDVKAGIKDTLVELVDFTATAFDFCNIMPQYTHFGKSLRSVIDGSKDFHRDAAFCEGGRLFGETHCMEKQSTSHTNSSGLYYPRVHLQSSENGEHSKAVMCRTEKYKYVRRMYESDEFYDLVEDPNELVNVIENPEYLQEIIKHKDRLLTFYLETGDIVPWVVDER